MTLRGLTWDHPRAYQPLQAFAAHRPDLAVSWDRQSLADFEAKPIAELAQSYDLMIIDHPGLGAAIAAQAIQPLDRLVRRPARRVAGQRGRADLGQLHRSAGHQWAVPIDARHPGVGVPAGPAGRRTLPCRDWAEVPGLARRHRTALCLGGPHSFLTLLAMCASARPRRARRPADSAPGDAAAALDILRAVWAEADQEISAGRPDRGARGPRRRDRGLLPAGLRLRQLHQARRWPPRPGLGRRPHVRLAAAGQRARRHRPGRVRAAPPGTRPRCSAS